jgi:Na+/H+ antiporter NhaD/arsenite permease-like protein
MDFTKNIQRLCIDIDWPLLVMFVGLFVVVAGFEKAVITPEVTAAASHLRLDNIAVLAAATAVLSNVVSNVPAVLMLKPFVPNLHDPQRSERSERLEGPGLSASFVGLAPERRRTSFQFFILRS